MDETEGEIGTHLQFLFDVGEDTARNQRAGEADGVGVEVVQVGDGELVEGEEELFAVVMAVEGERMVVIDATALQTGEIGPFRIVDLPRLVLRMIYKKRTLEVFDGTHHLGELILAVAVHRSFLIFHIHDQRVNLLHLNLKFLVVEVALMHHKIKKAGHHTS